MTGRVFAVLVLAAALGAATPGVHAQVAPTPAEIAAYKDLFAAAARGDVPEIAKLAAAGADVKARDGHGRTPLHVAAFAGRLRLTLISATSDVRHASPLCLRAARWRIMANR